MIQAIALDDEPMALEVIKVFCAKVPFVELSHTFTQASLAKKQMQKFPVDLVFLDIRMPDINGLEFSKSIPKEAMIIFTTAFRNYAVEGFDVKALDYLVKPFKFERFKEACDKAREHYEFFKKKSGEGESCLLVRAEYALVRIPFSEIQYLETMDDYIKIHCVDKKPVLTLMSMKNMMEKLPQVEFIRTHRSFAVALSAISSVRGKKINVGAAEIPIGISYEEAFLMRYMDTGT